MALPSSGPLTLADIQTEFGGSNPISLNEYYAGGGRVPAGTSGTYGAVPTSGTISIRNFYGTSNVQAYMVVTTSGASVSTSGNYKIATFTGSGTLTVASLGADPTEGSTLQYLVVAGGGAGGQGVGSSTGIAGGGGAGLSVGSWGSRFGA